MSFWPTRNNALTPIRQRLCGMLRNEGVGFGAERRRQHPARTVTGDFGQRVIHRCRLTQGDNVGIVLDGASFLLEVLAGLITRHDTPPSQTPSPISQHSSPSRSEHLKASAPSPTQLELFDTLNLPKPALSISHCYILAHLTIKKSSP